MANLRTTLKPYKNFEIVRINNYKYIATNRETRIETYDLKALKKQIDKLTRDTSTTYLQNTYM